MHRSTRGAARARAASDAGSPRSHTTGMPRPPARPTSAATASTSARVRAPHTTCQPRAAKCRATARPRVRTPTITSVSLMRAVYRAPPAARDSLRAVAGELEVSTALEAKAARGDRPFPVADGEAQLLVLAQRTHLQRQAGAGDAHAQRRGIAHARARAAPQGRRRHREGVRPEEVRAPGGVDEGGAALGGGAPVAAAQAVDHQVAAVPEVQRQPVPALQRRAERAGAPLAIEPARAADLEGGAVDGERARRGPAGGRGVEEGGGRRATPRPTTSVSARCRM